MIDKNIFNENISVIVEPDGNEVNIVRKNAEGFHFQLIKRINKEIMPGILNLFPQDIRNYTGYEIACILTSIKYAIIMPVNIYQKGNMFLTIPEDASPEQLKSLENLMKYLEEDILYVIITKASSKNNNTIPEAIKSYKFSKNSKKTLRRISELKNKKELEISEKNVSL